MIREDSRQGNVQQETASLPLPVEAASSPLELEPFSSTFKTASADIGRSGGRQNVLFKTGDRVRYDGQSMDKLGLKAGMEGEVVGCLPASMDVYFTDLQRVVHLKDFHMRTSVRRLAPQKAAAKKEKRGKKAGRTRRLPGLIASAILTIAVILLIINFKYPELLQEENCLRYFRLR
jgi:hypothetical protein